jgi:hypothetical protein
MMTKLVRTIMLILFVLVSVPFGIFLFVRSRFRRKPRPGRPVTMTEIARAEARLGFEMPEALRAFFLERPAMRHDCAEPYSIDGAVREYRMLTKAPYGPNGQDWPRNLFPFADLIPGYACFDLESATVVIWDPEELEDEDDPPELWEQSFTRTGHDLAAWLKRG